MTKKEIHQQKVLARKLQKAQIKLAKEEVKRKLKEEQELLKQNIEYEKFNKEIEDNYLLINQIVDLIDDGKNNDFIISTRLYNVRNSIYEISKVKKYHLNTFLKAYGPVQEHINGRQKLGIYILWCIINEYIKTTDDLKDFYLKYCVHINTTSEFNNMIRKFQNTKDGAISQDIYISEYEKYYGIELSEGEKELFSSHFLTSRYGKITNNDLIDYIRANKEKILKLIFC